MNILPNVYKICIQSWSTLQEPIQLCNNDIDFILKNRIFWNSSITFQNKPIVFISFLQSNLRRINDIWDSNNNNLKGCNDICNLLIDRRNCISKFSNEKIAIHEKLIKVLKGETEIVPERRATFNINDKQQILNESNTTISPDKLKIKIIQGIFKQKIKPKCQIIWEEQYGDNIDWTQN